jgi:RNA polymerase sigma-70 factor (ECF subfamily)
MTRADVSAAAESAARSSYGRLVAVLAAADGDIALAEDTLQDAFAQALVTWPQSGIPSNPEGWLITVARNRQRDIWKSAAARTRADWLELGAASSTVHPNELDLDTLDDKRLELLFVCAHPAIDPAVRVPLMLQVVLGFEASQIAAVFAMPAATLAQRLVRAKRRIHDARIPFALPTGAKRAERLPAVLESVYGCFSIGWDDAGAASLDAPESMAGEAFHLAVTLAELLGDEPEAWSLAALLALSLSRKNGAASEAASEFVPLDEQDPLQWDSDLIARGETYLRQAAAVTHGTPGRLQLEAAMQAVHAARRHSGVVDWPALGQLSEALVTIAPTLGSRVAHAAIVGRLAGPSAGLAELERIELPAAGFQPYFAVRADLLSRLGDARASEAFASAAATATPPHAAYLLSRAAATKS